MEVWLKLGCLKSFVRQINDRKMMQLLPNGRSNKSWKHINPHHLRSIKNLTPEA